MFELVKLGLRITGDDFNDEITLLINAGLKDLGLTDIKDDLLTDQTTDPLLIKAVTTYVKLNFGEPDEYERLKQSYDEQKAQLLMSSKYSDFSEVSNG